MNQAYEHTLNLIGRAATVGRVSYLWDQAGVTARAGDLTKEELIDLRTLMIKKVREISK